LLVALEAAEPWETRPCRATQGSAERWHSATPSWLCIAALAEVAHFRELNAEPVGVHGALQMISLVAQVLFELPETSGESLLLPQTALTRTARLLDASEQMVRGGAVVSPDLPGDAGPALADAFARDASTLRSLLGEIDG
jgi:hypothetical protein